MASNRRPPQSCLIATVLAVYEDGRPVPWEQAWLRFDVAQRFARESAKWRHAHGFDLAVSALGRSPERSAELYPAGGGLDGHVLGSAVDVSFRLVRAGLKLESGRELEDRAIAELVDTVMARAGLFPLGASRWPDQATGRKGDSNHYQTDDYGGKRKCEPQVWTAPEMGRSAIWNPERAPWEAKRVYELISKGAPPPGA